MKKVLNSVAILLSLSMIFSCKQENPEKPSPTPTPKEAIVIDKGVDTKPTIKQEGGEAKVSFTATENWTASVINTKADSWISLDKTSGSVGSATITIKAQGNDTPDDRSATVQIKAGKTTIDIVVSQKGRDALTTTASKNEFGPEGGALTIEVRSNIDFTYSIDEGCRDWISESATKAMATTTLQFNVAENEDVARREGSIIIKSSMGEEVIKVYQSGVDPTIVITQNEFKVGAEGETIQVEVSSNVNVEMVIPEDCDWIKEDETKAISTNTFYLNVSENTSLEPRTTKVVFKNAENELAEEVTINQTGREAVHVESISLDKIELSLTEGDNETLVATVFPENADNKIIIWRSSDEGVAVVDQAGKVSAVSAGTAIVSVTSKDGGKTASCSVSVLAKVPDGAVDLGLSVFWASCNLGASKPEEYGFHYQWAGLEDVTNTRIQTWENCPYHITNYPLETGWTKYIPSAKSSYWSGTGDPDNKTKLDLEDDVAHVTLGDKWRMPTIREYKELLDNCTSLWTTMNGVYGVQFTSSKNGNSIFLPAAGFYDDMNIFEVDFRGYYWSSSLSKESPCYAGLLQLEADSVAMWGWGRCFGLSVRPVSD